MQGKTVPRTLKGPQPLAMNMTESFRRNRLWISKDGRLSHARSQATDLDHYEAQQRVKTKTKKKGGFHGWACAPA